MGVVQPQISEHQEDRDRNRDGWHHPCRQDEEQQVIFERHFEPAECVGCHRAQDHTQGC